MGLSFYVNLNPNGHLIIGSPEKDDVGCYKQIFSDFKVGGGRNIWKRENFKFQKKIATNELLSLDKKIHFYLKMNILMFSVTKDLIEFFLIIRPTEENNKIITISLQNNTPLGLSLESICLFQSAIECKFDDNQNDASYPTGKFQKSIAETDDEENNLNLIYRNKKIMLLDMVAQLTSRSIKMKIS